MKTVALFGSARPTPEQAIYGDTVNAARLLAAHGWTIATGGGPGLMEAANLGAREICGDGAICSLGYSIYLPFEAETNSSVQVDTHYNDFFTRLKQFTDDCDAFIALPGGYGTLLEIMIVAQLLQVGHMEDKPLILVGQDWESIMEHMSDILLGAGFISAKEKFLWRYTDTALEAARCLL